MNISIWVCVMPDGDRPYCSTSVPRADLVRQWQAEGGEVFQIDTRLPLTQKFHRLRAAAERVLLDPVELRAGQRFLPHGMDGVERSGVIDTADSVHVTVSWDHAQGSGVFFREGFEQKIREGRVQLLNEGGE